MKNTAEPVVVRQVLDSLRRRAPAGRRGGDRDPADRADRHDEVPDHVVVTTGTHLDGPNLGPNT
ncbi:hypothetical protein [Frankia sp. R82]|uniref:hypothetical protein n=1 Tax=Frankia sp. R82 TaxID=2950553 RepID=UPI0020440391|nr:hypothetical protein [Frankia sp. R82]MCM3882530.1 hypothetical protein [Frankia sp. R82]